MLAKDFITNEVPVLKSFDIGEYGLSLMEEFKLHHLPVVKDGVYQSLVSEKDLLEMDDPAAPIGDQVFFAPSVYDTGHLYEVMALLSRYKLSLLPVVDHEGRYLGVITHQRMIEAVTDLCCAGDPGSILVLEMLPQDYVLSDIARLVEDNNARILNVFSMPDPETGRLAITLKINLVDASPVLRSFERFNYTVLYHFMETGIVDDVLQQRMDELLFYMNM